MVYIGSAGSDENGRYKGGKAGDNNGKEVRVQKWYRHKKGWVILRCRRDDLREMIALSMEAACRNNAIGYDQSQRLTCYERAKEKNFEIGAISTPCETDCSALVRVCLAAAGIFVESFRTKNEVQVLSKTGLFDVIADGSAQSDKWLRRGDILVTKGAGHTVVVLSDGDGAPLPEYGDRYELFTETMLWRSPKASSAALCRLPAHTVVTYCGLSPSDLTYCGVTAEYAGKKQKGYIPLEVIV